METTTLKTSPKDFFLYAFAAGALYFSAVTLVTLFWQLINHWLPVPGAFDYYYYEGDAIGAALRWAIALLVIVFPAYVITMWWIGRDLDREPEKRHLWVRRWLIYGTLFVAAVTLTGDLVYLVYTFLGGDVALRFALKAAAVALVAGAVFAYHLFLLRREPGTRLGTRKAITVLASGVVAAAIIAGFSVAGSPGSALKANNDARRVGDLQNLQYQVTNFWQQKQRLPANLEELVDPANPMPLPTDPVTGDPYRYEAVGNLGFKLCATFETILDKDTPRVAAPDYYGVSAPGDREASWQHDVGERCFDREIDPERYPPLGQPPAVVR